MPFFYFSFQNNLLNSPHIWIQSPPCNITTFSFHLCLSCVATLSLLPSFHSTTCPETRGTRALETDEDNRVSVLIEVVVVVREGEISADSRIDEVAFDRVVWACWKTDQQDATQGHCSTVSLIHADNVISLPLSSIKYLSGVQNWMSPPEDVQLIFGVCLLALCVCVWARSLNTCK